jgi:cytochrome c biogenesis protein CcdA/thiol-disulfide isomerase/thioredoxin
MPKSAECRHVQRNKSFQMNLLLPGLAFAGGVLTILSPCILPVLPFIFARADRPFTRSSLPLLAGLAVTFAAVASLGAAAGAWAVQLNIYGRWIALAALALVGLSLLAPQWADRATAPFTRLGNRLASAVPHAQPRSRHQPLSSFLLGVATGLLWAPCAGPILGLILTGAVIQGPNMQTSTLLFFYAVGGATGLCLVLLVGGRFFKALQHSARFTAGLRQGLGAAVLASVGAIALGFDTGALAQLPSANSPIEQRLLDQFRSQPVTPAALASPMVKVQAVPKLLLPVEGAMPPLNGLTGWLNSPELTAASLRGKVVLIEFWTYSCYNCKNVLPYVRAWHEKYKDQGLVVIGVHAPEFAYEKNLNNLKTAVAEQNVPYPIAIDNNFAVWRAFNNQYWPAMYFVDAKGQIRYHHFGEGAYDKGEKVIQQLLQEARSSAPMT